MKGYRITQEQLLYLLSSLASADRNDDLPVCFKIPFYILNKIDRISKTFFLFRDLSEIELTSTSGLFSGGDYIQLQIKLFSFKKILLRKIGASNFFACSF